MDGKAPKDNRKKDFTPAQVKLILETAARVKFGGPSHEDFMWMLRLLAFTGARPNEISMLQSGDIVRDEETGIQFIHIRDTDAVTGEKHLEKSIKTGEVRRVPLHPAVEDFFDYTQTFDKDAFIFGRFTYHKTGKRAHPLISVFGSFVREDCGIKKDPTKRLVLYSFRHRFETALREAQVFEDIRTALMGHGKDIPAGYGSWPLPTLFDAVKKTKPMG